MELKRIIVGLGSLASAALVLLTIGSLSASTETAGWIQGVCQAVRVAASDPQITFGRILDLDVDSRGRIYAADPDGAAVVVLDAQGKLLHTIGRRGAGPGEFRNLHGLQILPGDSLFSFDLDLARVSVFPPDSARPAYVVNLTQVSQTRAPLRVIPLPEQRVLVALRQRPASTRGDEIGTQVIDVHEWNGEMRWDSVLSRPASSMVLIARQSGRLIAGGNPFGRPALIRIGPAGRIYYGWGDSLAIEIFSLQGRRLGGFSRPYEPPKITRREVEGALEKASPALRDVLLEEIPETWPAFRNFLVDDVGRIWVGLVQPEGHRTRWTAFDEGGRELCSVVFQGNFAPYRIRSGRAYGVSTDSLDVPTIEVYEIRTHRRAEEQAG